MKLCIIKTECGQTLTGYHVENYGNHHVMHWGDFAEYPDKCLYFTVEKAQEIKAHLGDESLQVVQVGFFYR